MSDDLAVLARDGGGKATPDLEGRRFGRLVVREWAGLVDDRGGAQRNSYWRCDCDCGGTKLAQATNLRAGRVRSCGCLNRDAAPRRVAARRAARG